MGNLFSGWHRDKCCIVRFLSLNGLKRFVFWTQGRMPALSSVWLLISPLQSTPSGKLLGEGGNPPTSLLPRQHDWMMSVSLWRQRSLIVTYTVRVRHPLNELQDYICGCKAGRQTSGGKFIAGCSYRNVGWWVLMAITSGRREMGFLFLICFPLTSAPCFLIWSFVNCIARHFTFMQLWE